MSSAAPNSTKRLRACLQCHLVKTHEQFYQDGCDNCHFFNMQNDKNLVESCTSTNFEGIISMMQPTESWVARWNRIVPYVPGCYCISVTGDLPEHCLSLLEDAGVKYRGNQ
eukprot:GILI01011033.1.p1 GENE.GILI01011033.1~~GILI01011033.1.p1  ORF type:complete len:127 (+),score=21.52 GILI01011033.1:51-383(+)